MGASHPFGSFVLMGPRGFVLPSLFGRPRLGPLRPLALLQFHPPVRQTLHWLPLRGPHDHRKRAEGEPFLPRGAAQGAESIGEPRAPGVAGALESRAFKSLVVV